MFITFYDHFMACNGCSYLEQIFFCSDFAKEDERFIVSKNPKNMERCVSPSNSPMTHVNDYFSYLTYFVNIYNYENKYINHKNITSHCNFFFNLRIDMHIDILLYY